MNKILERFGRARVLLPVIHCMSEEQVARNIGTALSNGTDGVFLINQGGLDAKAVFRLGTWYADGHFTARARTPGDALAGGFLGVNLLGVDLPTVRQAFFSSPLEGLWVDNAEGDEPLRYNPKIHPTQIYFGGVAFKYQPEVSPARYAEVVKRARERGVDVITTSGPATGTPPTVEKIQALAEAAQHEAVPLAIASGITPANVALFLPFAHAFLVASGIEERFGQLDPVRVGLLADAIHAYTPEGTTP